MLKAQKKKYDRPSVPRHGTVHPLISGSIFKKELLST
jgi:hypothetical protein